VIASRQRGPRCAGSNHRDREDGIRNEVTSLSPTPAANSAPPLPGIAHQAASGFIVQPDGQHRCVRRWQFEPRVGFALIQLERAETQAWRRAQLVCDGSVVDQHVAQIGVGANSYGTRKLQNAVVAPDAPYGTTGSVCSSLPARHHRRPGIAAD
jgi:hypothetical protein